MRVAIGCARLPFRCAMWLTLLLLHASRPRAATRPTRHRRQLGTAVSPADFDAVEVWPNRPPTKKEAADSGVSLEAAQSMPWFPTHSIYCSNGTRLCRPGEGNLAGYRFWGQPYLHREQYVQSRRRRPPHEPSCEREYAALCTLARRVQHAGLVIVAARPRPDGRNRNRKGPRGQGKARQGLGLGLGLG